MRRVAGAALVLALAAGAAAAQPAREAARAALERAEDAGARRAAVQTLAEVGLMADVPLLARALRDADPLVRALAEQALWEVWSRSGDGETDRLFAIGVEQMTQQALAAAVETFTLVIARSPDFAEGWNKRATVYFLLGEYARSLADCDEVLARNPYHFGALAGAGMIHLRLDQPARALGFFERALDVNPNLAQVEEAVRRLRQLLLERRRKVL